MMTSQQTFYLGIDVSKRYTDFIILNSEKSARKQWTFIQMLTKQNTQLLNQFEKLLYCANPELVYFCNDSVPEWY